MEGIFVFGFDSEKGQQLYIDAVKNLTSTGLVDGFFGDKWGSHAAPDPNSTTSGWQICNHECGAVTEQQGRAWNAGKARVLETVTSIVGEGPYFANGGTFTGGKPGQGAGGPGGVTYNGERRRFFLPFASPKNATYPSRIGRRPALFFLGHISPIFAPFFLVFSRFSPS